MWKLQYKKKGFDDPEKHDGRLLCAGKWCNDHSKKNIDKISMCAGELQNKKTKKKIRNKEFRVR